MRKLMLAVFAMLVLLPGLFGCNNAEMEKRNAQLEAQVKNLQQELDEIKNGAAFRVNAALKHLNAKEYDKAIEFADKVIADFPNFPEAEKAASIKRQAETAKDAATQEEERLRQEEERRKRMERKRITSSLHLLEKEVDKVEGITWYQSSLLEKAPIQLYIGSSKNKSWLRTKTYYSAKNWLFVKNAVVYIDGTKYDLQTRSIKRDHSGGDIWEWSDDLTSKKDLEIIDKIIASKECVIRFYGDKYYDDKQITSIHKAALQSVLDGLEALKTS